MFTSDPSANTAADASRDAARHNALAPVGIIRDRRRTPAASSVFDPLTLARAVWNARLLILATTVLGICAAVTLALVTPKQYAATAQLIIDPRDIKVVANEVTPTALPSDATLALIESQTAVIMSNNVLSRVVEDAGLADDPEFNGETKTGLVTLLPTWMSELLEEEDTGAGDEEYRVLERVRYALTVGRETMSFVINLTFDSTDPVKAARIVNMVASVFIDEQGRVQSDTARRATTALSSRLSELRRSVVDSERAVEEYKSQNALVGVGGRLVDDQYITRINDELARARGDIPALRVRAESMRGASVEDVVRGTLPEELSAEALVRLRQTYSSLEQDAAVLAARLGPRHPQRIASEGALTAARQAIASELTRIVSSAQTELARAEETERNLTTQIDELKSKQIETSGSFVKLRELEREVDASRAVYEAFLLRARETGEQESLNTTNVRVISEATPPLRPFGMSRKVVVAAGGIVGFGIGIAIAALWAVLKLARGFFTRERRVAPEARWPESGPNGPADLLPSGPGAYAKIYHDAPQRPSPPDGSHPTNREIDGNEGTTSAPAASDGDGRRNPGLAEADTAAGEARNAQTDHIEPSERQPAAEPAVPQDDSVRDVELAPAAAAPSVDDEPAADPSDNRAPGVPVSEDETDAGETPAAVSATRPVGDLTLAQVARGGGARVETRERLSLRERVRALSTAASTGTAGARSADGAPVDPEVALLHDEIQTVKQAIADIRRRRETKASGS